jgi:hypothetical protein
MEWWSYLQELYLQRMTAQLLQTVHFCHDLYLTDLGVVLFIQNVGMKENES